MVELRMLRNISCVFSICVLIAYFIPYVESKDWRYEACKPTNCGSGPDISYPFYIPDENSKNGTICGYPGFEVSCKGDKAVFKGSSSGYIIESITSLHFSANVVSLCTLYNCTDAFPCQSYVSAPVESVGGSQFTATSKVNYTDLLENGFTLTWAGISCSECEKTGGHCGSDASGTTVCYCPDQPYGSYCKQGKSKLGLILGTVGGGLFILVIILVVLFYVWYRKQGIDGFTDFLSVNTSRISSKLDLELGNFFFGVPIFSYYELKKITKNFDRSNQLGAGGFGTVYYGKLRDGREVAVKCLYENNYKRFEQFKNEVEILTRLRHRNLVSLYGCTSRRSRELLLVYEYISNGTVADHLHGDKAKNRSLTWPIRMNIAIETASALAYLHASDTIHRDVKTNNILLDDNYCVKVADFGLSRLFPSGVSHISTAPQGTPGYVDPEYHQCYQLTDKSDVYSFGVVLAELLSSMPDYKRMATSVAGLAFRCLQLQKDLRPTMDEVVKNLKAQHH